MLLNIVFYIVSFFIIASSLGVILSRNPMTSILSMVFAFFNTSILFILLRAEFVAMVMLIVYIGAISVLFVFMIMLLNIKSAEKRNIFTGNFKLGAFVSITIFIEVFFIIKMKLLTLPILKNVIIFKDINNSYNLSLYLYNNYSFIVLLLGILLTVVIIGIIFINHQDDTFVKKQKMSEQVKRNSETSVKAVKVEIEQGIK